MSAGNAPAGAVNGGPGGRPADAGRPSGTGVPAGTGAAEQRDAATVPGSAWAGPAAATVVATSDGPADAVLAGLRRQVRELLADLDGSVRRIRLGSGDTVLEVEWHPDRVRPAESAPGAPPAPVTPVAEPPAVPPPVAAPARHAVRSLIVGTFYRAPEPGAAPFVSVGDRVQPGQVVGIVEAMKLMNEVTADRAGRVAEILADDGQPVEYDQPLFALDPA